MWKKSIAPRIMTTANTLNRWSVSLAWIYQMVFYKPDISPTGDGLHYHLLCQSERESQWNLLSYIIHTLTLVSSDIIGEKTIRKALGWSESVHWWLALLNSDHWRSSRRSDWPVLSPAQGKWIICRIFFCIYIYLFIYLFIREVPGEVWEHALCGTYREK